MTAHTVELQAAERALVKAYPVKMLGYGAFVGNILSNGINVIVSVLYPEIVPPLSAAISILMSGTVFVFYSNALSKLRKGIAGFLAIFFWLCFAVLALGLVVTMVSALMGGPALSMLFIAVYLLLTWTVAVGWWALFGLDDGTRGLLKAPFEGFVSKAAIAAYSGLPPIIEFVRKDRLSSYTYSILSTGCLVVSLASVSILPLALLVVREMVLQVALVGVGIACFFGFSLLANAFLRMARRRIRLSIDELTATDPRRPVLFLRAFRDDRAVLPAPRQTLMGRVLAAGVPKQTLDELLLDEGTLYGPVVALGNPQEPTPPYGAARGYFSNESWQQAVGRLASDALAIVVSVDDTDAIWWEIAHIVRAKLVQKTLFLLPPHIDSRESARIFRKVGELLSRGQSGPRIDAAQLEQAGAIGFFIDDDGSTRIGRSTTFSRDAYFAMLRLFFRTKYGMQVRRIAGSGHRDATRLIAAEDAGTDRAVNARPREAARAATSLPSLAGHPAPGARSEAPHHRA